MPYKIFEEDGKFCVYKVDAEGGKGELVDGGCHESENDALAHLTALRVNVESGEKELDKMYTVVDEPPVPADTSLMTFDDLEAMEEMLARRGSLIELAETYTGLVKVAVEIAPRNLAEYLDTINEQFVERVASLSDDAEEEGEVDKEVWTAAYVNDLPDSAFLFVEPGGEKDDEGKTLPRNLRHLPFKDRSGKPDSAHLRNAIARAPQVKLRSGQRIPASTAKKIQTRAQKMLRSIKKENGVVGVVRDAIKELFAGMSRGNPDRQDMMVWKEESGRYAWVARYSNNIIDDDNPPDIISANSHRRFVDLVDKSLAPLPDLRIWHVGEWIVGKARAVAYDESGFAIATGFFDVGMEDVAEWVIKNQKDLALSHGMPLHTIKRDPLDHTVIVEHETREISLLPRWAAANKRTSFYTLGKEDNMSIPEDKKRELVMMGLSEQVLARIEAVDKEDAQKAAADGLRSKETQPPAPEAETPAPETHTEEAVEPAEEQAVDPADQAPSRTEVAEAIAAVVAPALEQMTQTVTGMARAIKQMSERIDAVEASTEAAHKRSEELVKQLDGAPGASVAAILLRSIGQTASQSSKTAVADGDPVKESRPKETEVPSRPVTGINFIDQMLNQQQ